MALSQEELDLIDKHKELLKQKKTEDQENLNYYNAKQTIKQLGMAIPPNFDQFLVPAGWPRTYIDLIRARQNIREVTLPGEDKADETLVAIWRGSNLKVEVDRNVHDALLYGRAPFSIWPQDETSLVPRVKAESPRQLSVDLDPVTEQAANAVRLYGDTEKDKDYKGAVIYTPEQIIRAMYDKERGWVEVEGGRTSHTLGAVPVVMHLNNAQTGSMEGHSLLTPSFKGLVDSVARSITLMQFTQETHGIPRVWMKGVKPEDFMDDNGRPLPLFEAYFDAIHMLTDREAHVGQLNAADLKNYETAIRVYGIQASIETKLPARYWGLTTANPASEGAMVNDEINLNRSVEALNDAHGVAIGRAMAIAYKLTGVSKDQDPDLLAVTFHNPATPTIAQREDALFKRRQAGALSIRGYMTELGWSEARVEQELQWLAEERAAAQLADPYLTALAAKDNAAGTTPAVKSAKSDVLTPNTSAG